MPTRAALGLALLFATVLSGCASTARYMFEVKPARQLAAPPDAALMVFIRPSKMAFGVAGNIIDENGHFMGDAAAKGHFAVPVAPERHTFIIWAENTDALVAD